MQSNHPAPARGQHLDVAQGLRHLHRPESIRAPRDGQIDGGVVGREHQEHPGRRPALEHLAGRVEIARPEPHAGRHAAGVADAAAQALQRRPVNLVVVQIREQRHVVTRPRACQMGRDQPFEGGLPPSGGPQALGGVRIGEQGDPFRPRQGAVVRPAAGGLPGRGQGPRRDLGGLHVRLVERVHAQHRPADGDGELPPEELAGQRAATRQRKGDDGMAGGGEGGEGGVLPRIGIVVDPHVDEQPVVPVRGGRTELLVDDRNQPPPRLARRLRQQLLDPRAEGADRGRQHESGLVPAGGGGETEHEP